MPSVSPDIDGFSEFGKFVIPHISTAESLVHQNQLIGG